RHGPAAQDAAFPAEGDGQVLAGDRHPAVLLFDIVGRLRVVAVGDQDAIAVDELHLVPTVGRLIDTTGHGTGLLAVDGGKNRLSTLVGGLEKARGLLAGGSRPPADGRTRFVDAFERGFVFGQT